MLIENEDSRSFQLTDERVEEVRRRMTDKGTPTLALEELDERLRDLGIKEW